MKKSIKQSLVVAAGVLSVAGIAQAATIDVNLYGASAEATLWSALSAPFLQAAAPAGPGCATVTVKNSGGSAGGIATGTGCNGAANDTINFRYTGKNSIDGILSVKGQVDPNVTTGCTNATDRKLFGSTASTAPDTCLPIDLGASDVSGDAFVQRTYGQLKGPLAAATDPYVTRSYTGISTTGLNSYRPVVVPFAFFVDNSVSVSKCSGGAHDGNLCTTATAATDCGAGISCLSASLDNVTREMAVNIFSGNAMFWSDFGASYTVTGKTPAVNDNITACFRAAGSGTHATLDAAVMNKSWGAPLLQNQTAYAFFNDSTGDLMNCLGARTGSIGYADADATAPTTVHVVKYNGVPARRNTIRNGNYDFWSAQWLFESAAAAGNAAKHNLITQLNSFASNSANLSAATLPTKYPFWATAGEMVYGKPTDFTYPTWQLPSSPMTP